jgi:DCN1-like protein 1/2
MYLYWRDHQGWLHQGMEGSQVKKYQIICPSLKTNVSSCDTIAKQKTLISNYKSAIGAQSFEKQLEAVYKHTFTLMLQSPTQRSADKDNCMAMWTILFSTPSINWTTQNVNYREEWIEFIGQHKSIKGINRDQWNHVLKFARLSLADEKLRFHSEEQSWPSIIDEFAASIKKKMQFKRGVEGSEMEF